MAERYKPWSDDEIAKLGTAADAEIAQLLGRSYEAVGLRRRELKIAARHKPWSKRRWSQDEIAKLGTAPDAEIAHILGRLSENLGRKRRQLKIPVFQTGIADAAIYCPPTPDQDKQIFEHIDAESLRVIELARMLYRVTWAEIFDLTVGDVDLWRKVIKVQGLHTREERISNAACTLFREFICDRDESAPAICRIDGSRFTRDMITSRWRRACELAGVPHGVVMRSKAARIIVTNKTVPENYTLDEAAQRIGRSPQWVDKFFQKTSREIHSALGRPGRCDPERQGTWEDAQGNKWSLLDQEDVEAIADWEDQTFKGLTRMDKAAKTMGIPTKRLRPHYRSGEITGATLEVDGIQAQTVKRIFLHNSDDEEKGHRGWLAFAARITAARQKKKISATPEEFADELNRLAEERADLIPYPRPDATAAPFRNLLYRSNRMGWSYVLGREVRTETAEVFQLEESAPNTAQAGEDAAIAEQPTSCTCGGTSFVLRTRPKRDRTIRRRQCRTCGARWTTSEMRRVNDVPIGDAGTIPASPNAERSPTKFAPPLLVTRRLFVKSEARLIDAVERIWPPLSVFAELLGIPYKRFMAQVASGRVEGTDRELTSDDVRTFGAGSQGGKRGDIRFLKELALFHGIADLPETCDARVEAYGSDAEKVMRQWKPYAAPAPPGTSTLRAKRQPKKNAEDEREKRIVKILAFIKSQDSPPTTKAIAIHLGYRVASSGLKGLLKEMQAERLIANSGKRGLGTTGWSLLPLGQQRLERTAPDHLG